jgi:invasion protein IalB
MKTGKTQRKRIAMALRLDRSSSIAAVAALTTLIAPAMAPAQEADAAREPGDPYVAEVFTDWELRCITAAEEGQAERCEMFQLLLDEQDNPVAVFRVNVPLVPSDSDIVATAVIVTPLETLLTPGIRVRIDDSEPVGIPYTLCEPTGCLARIPLTPENVELLSRPAAKRHSRSSRWYGANWARSAAFSASTAFSPPKAKAFDRPRRPRPRAPRSAPRPARIPGRALRSRWSARSPRRAAP